MRLMRELLALRLLNDILSVLGLDSEYTVEYTPSVVPSGFVLRNAFRQRGIFDRISLYPSCSNTDTLFPFQP